MKAPPAKPCVSVPRAGRVGTGADSAEVHWADLGPGAVRDGVTTPVQTVVDCARAYDRYVALSAADSALRAGDVDRDELLEAARQSPRTGRRRAVWVAEQASALADNPFESVLRAIALGVAGLEVVPQVWVGTIGRVDLADARLLIAIEADSYEHHGTKEAFKVDVRRYTDVAAQGWILLRFLWEDVMHRPEWVAERLARAVAVRTRQLAPTSEMSAVRRA